MSVGPVQRTNVVPVTIQPSTPPAAEHREMIQAVKAINASELFGQQNELTFAFNRHTGRFVMRIVDRRNRQVIREIPPEYALRLARDLRADSD